MMGRVSSVERRLMRDPAAVMTWRLIGSGSAPGNLSVDLGTLRHAPAGATTANGAAARWIWDTGTAAGLSSSLARAVRAAEAAIISGARSAPPVRAGAGFGSVSGVTRSITTSIGGMRSGGRSGGAR